MKFSVRNFSHKYADNSNIGLITLNEEQTKRLQEINYQIYLDVFSLCRKHNLQISLSGGSVLGSVRHKGFIPWDDDIDVMMPRKDFNAFMKIFKDELGDKYYMACPDARYSDQYNYIIKVIDKDSVCADLFEKQKLFHQGIAVDILPIDYVPNNPILYGLKGYMSILLLFILNSNMMYICNTNLVKKIFTQTLASSLYFYFRIVVGFFASIIPYHKWCRIYNDAVSGIVCSKRVSIPCGRNHYFKETQLAEVFYPFREAIFEKNTAFIPNDYDTYLRPLYGEDYMNLPPIEKRERHLCSKLILY